MPTPQTPQQIVSARTGIAKNEAAKLLEAYGGNADELRNMSGPEILSKIRPTKPKKAKSNVPVLPTEPNAGES